MYAQRSLILTVAMPQLLWGTAGPRVSTARHYSNMAAVGCTTASSTAGFMLPIALQAHLRTGMMHDVTSKPVTSMQQAHSDPIVSLLYSMM